MRRTLTQQQCVSINPNPSIDWFYIRRGAFQPHTPAAQQPAHFQKQKKNPACEHLPLWPAPNHSIDGSVRPSPRHDGRSSTNYSCVCLCARWIDRVGSVRIDGTGGGVDLDERKRFVGSNGPAGASSINRREQAPCVASAGALTFRTHMHRPPSIPSSIDSCILIHLRPRTPIPPDPKYSHTGRKTRLLVRVRAGGGRQRSQLLLVFCPKAEAEWTA